MLSRCSEWGPRPRAGCDWCPAPAVSIDAIQEVSEGRQSEIFQRYPDGIFDPNCCFSIYHGSHRESLDLVSPSGDEARAWVTGLRYLMAGISDEDSLARRQRTRDQYPWSRVQTSGTSYPPCWGSPAPGGVTHVGKGRREGVLGLGSAPPPCPWRRGRVWLALLDPCWSLTRPGSG